MNDPTTTPWSRLAAAARRPPSSALAETAACDVPAGFSTRVVAVAKLQPSTGLFAGRAFERLAGRALAFSCAGALAVTVWASIPATLEAAPLNDAFSATDFYLDPVGAVLEVVES